jgi:hypothetical protein
MDVERTLGAPDQKIDNELMAYYLPEGVVYFHFTSNPKCKQKLPFTSWDVSSDTVTGIYIALKHPLLVSKAGFDLTKFKKQKGDQDAMDHYVYILEDGFAIEVNQNYIGRYSYGPGNKQKDLRCEASKSQ